MKASEVLKRAKARLWRGKGRRKEGESMFICEAMCTSGAPINDFYRVGDYITNRISPHVYATSWLAARVGRDTLQRAGMAKIQAWRHAWADQLIAEVEAKGD